MKSIIIGIDPGTTTAFCIIDFYKNIIKKDSSKRFNLKNLIRETTKAGNPVIVGCDKEKVPDFVEKFRRKFNARIYCPKKDLTQKEKKDVVNK
jgi:predicted RNase H-like nuclease (RuvC/YqgF family)